MTPPPLLQITFHAVAISYLIVKTFEHLSSFLCSKSLESIWGDVTFTFALLRGHPKLQVLGTYLSPKVSG